MQEMYLAVLNSSWIKKKKQFLMKIFIGNAVLQKY